MRPVSACMPSRSSMSRAVASRLVSRDTSASVIGAVLDSPIASLTALSRLRSAKAISTGLEAAASAAGVGVGASVGVGGGTSQATAANAVSAAATATPIVRTSRRSGLDHSAFRQHRQLRAGQAQLPAEHLSVVLAHQGRPAGDAPRRTVVDAGGAGIREGLA